MPPKKLDTRKPFALALRHWRQSRDNMTMVEAARIHGVPYRTWQDWERGIHEPRGFARRLILERLT